MIYVYDKKLGYFFSKPDDFNSDVYMDETNHYNLWWVHDDGMIGQYSTTYRYNARTDRLTQGSKVIPLWSTPNWVFVEKKQEARQVASLAREAGIL